MSTFVYKCQLTSDTRYIYAVRFEEQLDVYRLHYLFRHVSPVFKSNKKVVISHCYYNMSVLIHKPQLDSLLAELNSLTALSFIADEDVLPEHQCEQIVSDATQTTLQLRLRIDQVRLIDDQLAECRNRLAPLLKQLDCDLRRVRRIKQMRLLVDLFRQVKSAHESLNSIMNANSTTKRLMDCEPKCLQGIAFYEQLLHIWNQLKALSAQSSFRMYVHNVIVHWNIQLKSRIQPLFDESVRSVGWPMIGPLASVSKSNQIDALVSFDKLFEALLVLETKQFEIQQHNETVAPKVFANSNLCLPMQRMLTPLKKRFAFHFLQDSKTNRLDKPEWYLTQILNWIKSHDQFLESHVEPLLKKCNFKFMPAKVCLFIEKIKQSACNSSCSIRRHNSFSK